MTHPALDGALAILPTTDLAAVKVRGLLRGYHARWGDQEFDVLSVENTVTANLWNPATKASSRTFTVAGKLDLTAMRDGRRTLFDHKTTGEDIKDPAGPYWKQLVIEAQPSHYALLEWLNGRKVDEIVWDVLRKPDIRPKAVAKQDRLWTSRSRNYFGVDLSTECISEMESTERENLEMYEARLAHDAQQRPDHYFQRRTIPRLDADVHEHASEIWENAKAIMFWRERSRAGNLPTRHSGSCMAYGRPCKFLGICSGFDEPNSDKWRVKTNVHSELPIIDGDGRGVLTNSRIRCFQQCPRKHYYSYELGIERVDEEEAESLYFGHLWHLALETYFTVIGGMQHGEKSQPTLQVSN